MEYKIKITKKCLYLPKDNNLSIQKDIIIKKGKPSKIKLGIKCEEKNNLSYFLKAHNNLYLRNYSRGRRVLIKIVNISKKKYKISRGDKLFQLVYHNLEKFKKGDVIIHKKNIQLTIDDKLNKNKNKLTIIPLIENFFHNSEIFHDGDSGLDIFCQFDTTINPGQTIMLDLGFSCYTTDGSDLYVLPRSSIYKTPIRMSDYIIPIFGTPLIMSNAIGLIDAGYRGQIMAVVDNLCEKDYLLKSKETIFSLVHPEKYFKNIEIVKKLNDTTRGEKGFGSTTKL